jgi:intracellular sulfur oxidation DsrE/DsrF family protein
MKKSLQRLALLMLAASISLGTIVAQAAEKSFAKHKVVLQISDPNPFKQTLVLNVAGNLIKHYGEDDVDVEIVAFGPGLRLLMDGNSNTTRIDGLSLKGVRFSACENTMRNFGKKLGGQPKLNTHAKTVKAGVVQIIDLVNDGYILVKP